jgi:hypothetical protein
MDWDDRENNLSTATDVDTRSTSELPSDVSDSTPKLPTRLINGRRYLMVDQSANRRAGVNISLIWPYGRELRLIDSLNFDKYWLYSLCPSQTILVKITYYTNSNTSAAIRYLKSIHKISFKKQKKEKEEEEKERDDASSLSTSPLAPNIAYILAAAPAKVAGKFKALVTRIDADNFR